MSFALIVVKLTVKSKSGYGPPELTSDKHGINTRRTIPFFDLMSNKGLSFSISHHILTHLHHPL
uniref:Uncharacterized protein n=1 Tax=Helianthus annuus TaxID=4232 RepID=A0A251UQH7_HELAN